MTHGDGTSASAAAVDAVPAQAATKPLSKVEQRVVEQALDYFYDYHTDNVCAILAETDPNAHYRVVIE